MARARGRAARTRARATPAAPTDRLPLLAGQCAAALTEDSDLLAYQCPAVLYKIKADGHARLYSWADVRTISGGVGGRRKQQQQQAAQLLFDGSAGWPDWELPFLQWAEREGYSIDVVTNADLEDRSGTANEQTLRAFMAATV